MLIEFKCRNFLSFKDEVCLNLTTVDTYTEHKDTHILKKNKLNLLKSIALYGSNGGGKSNLSKAITLMSTLIHYSFSDSLKKDEERGDWNGDFKLCNSTIGKPSMFEVSFFVGEDIYRYGFETYNWEVVSEWLYKTEKRETLLFSRKGNEFKINETRFEEGKRYKEVNQNVLFISFLAQYNSGESGKVFNFFKKLNIVNAISDDHISHVTRKLLKDDDKFKKWLSIALQFLEISSVHVSSDEKELFSKHPVYDENNLLTGFTDFSVERDESDGTKKLIYLLGAIYHTLKNGCVFVIDEFNAKLHPNLSLKIIELFHKYNNNGAQFIITVHDPTLLDKDVYRRDQFWFVDRNQFGSSELYPMSNFKATDGLRSMSDFRKKYLNSDFGAAESIELTQEFINISKDI
jgi:AAA15 family ATPase/GTPase